jgi:hypothetical protein
LYAEAQARLTAEVPAAFLWHSLNAFLVNPRASGLRPSALDVLWPGEADPLTVFLEPATFGV